MSSLGTDAARIAVRHRSHPHPDARLQAARDHHLICCPELFGRQNSLPHRETPHPCGVAALPETDRSGIARGAGTSPDCGQLCDSQTPEGAGMAEAASTRDRALHADRSSWMNLVERFFADLTADCVREGSFESVRDLIDAIDEFLAVRNEEPKRYVWRAKGEDILRKIEKAKAVLDRIINS